MAMNETMDEGMPMAGNMAEAPESESESESPTIFLTKDQLGGEAIQVGDTLTLTATDIDPESGEVAFEVSACCGGGEKKRMQSRGGYASDFDQAMPAEEEE
jgi:hypothetical protein